MLNMISEWPLLRLVRFATLGAVACALVGCATPGRTASDDPWAGMNRGIYKFNDGLDRAVLKPTAKGYKAVTPSWFRTGVGNFFDNLSYPLTAANQLLQGKPRMFVKDTGRFLTNSTLGLAGLFDVADRMGLPSNDEDFGQTLAVWGVPSGPYLMLPFLGPSTLRDGPARIPEWLVGGVGSLNVSDRVKWGARGLTLIDQRASLLTAEGTLDSAYDKYGVMRDAWMQRREYQIFDGNPPEEPLEILEDEPEEEAAPAAAP